MPRKPFRSEYYEYEEEFDLNQTDHYQELNVFDADSGYIRIYDEISPRTVKSFNEFIDRFSRHPSRAGTALV